MSTKTKRMILCGLMGVQSLILGLCISQAVKGNTDAYVGIVFAAVSDFVLLLLYMSTFTTQTTARSTDEIIDACWAEHTREKEDKKDGARDQRT